SQNPTTSCTSSNENKRDSSGENNPSKESVVVSEDVHWKHFHAIVSSPNSFAPLLELKYEKIEPITQAQLQLLPVIPNALKDLTTKFYYSEEEWRALDEKEQQQENGNKTPQLLPLLIPNALN